MTRPRAIYAVTLIALSPFAATYLLFNLAELIKHFWLLAAFGVIALLLIEKTLYERGRL